MFYGSAKSSGSVSESSGQSGLSSGSSSPPYTGDWRITIRGYATLLPIDPPPITSYELLSGSTNLGATVGGLVDATSDGLTFGRIHDEGDTTEQDLVGSWDSSRVITINFTDYYDGYVGFYFATDPGASLHLHLEVIIDDVSTIVFDENIFGQTDRFDQMDNIGDNQTTFEGQMILTVTAI
jgi:hypothetical protein